LRLSKYVYGTNFNQNYGEGHFPNTFQVKTNADGFSYSCEIELLIIITLTEWWTIFTPYL